MNQRTILARIGIIFFWLSLGTLLFYAPALWHQFFSGRAQLHIFAFTDSIPREIVRDFEQKFGVKVILNYFQTNEDLFAKLQISRGEGYDLIVCSDYMVELARKENLLSKIDQDNIDHFHDLDTHLMGRYFDPSNSFSLPFSWTFYGIGINREMIGDAAIESTWDTVFKKSEYELLMPDDAREVIFLASLHLFGRTQSLSAHELEQVKQLLIKQRSWVQTYGADKADYMLLSDIIPLVVCQASYIRKVMREKRNIDFVLPAEGSMLIIENIAIPSGAQNKRDAYRFINYMLTPEVAADISEYYGYNPSNTKAYPLLEEGLRLNKTFFPDDKMLARMQILSNDIPSSQLQDTWLAVKTA